MVEPAWFAQIDEIVRDDFRFKSKLHIGADAYKTLKARDAVFEFWDVVGAVGVGAKFAGSALVANTFFGSSSMLAMVGIGASATPIGWVAAAAVLSGAGWFGICRYLKSNGDMVDVIPKFINTPIDVLALSLFDFMCPLSLKVAAADGKITDDERDVIRAYFVKNWGYSNDFISEGMRFIEERLESFSVAQVAEAFALFSRENRDCNQKKMAQEIICHLKEVMEADEKIHEMEELVIEKIEQVFDREYSRIIASKQGSNGLSDSKEILASMQGGISSVHEKIKGVPDKLNRLFKK